MLELATAPVVDLPQDSIQGKIEVFFAESSAPCPQLYTVSYLVTPTGTPYVNLENLCRMAFFNFKVFESVAPLLAYRAIFHHKAKNSGQELFIPLLEVENFAHHAFELLENLVDSKARAESVWLYLAVECFKDIAANANKLYNLVLDDYQQKQPP